VAKPAPTPQVKKTKPEEEKVTKTEAIHKGSVKWQKYKKEQESGAITAKKEEKTSSASSSRKQGQAEKSSAKAPAKSVAESKEEEKDGF